jgi:uncharacterized protein (TIGR03118 family)
MITKIISKFSLFFLAGILLIASNTAAQSIAYRQTNLASDVAGFANNTDPLLRNPWGIALVPRLSFFVANTNNGHAIALDASGSRIGPVGFTIANPAATGPASPTGFVADPNSFFRAGNAVPPFTVATITATEDGGIYFWEENADGSFLPQATLVVNHSQQGAVYTALAILTPDCCAPFLAVANFHSGFVETYTTTFDPLATPGSFSDPGLPAGFSPFGMQVIGKQLFIAYALQDSARHDPLFGAGNGIVSVFDLEGHFVRRFAAAGPVNAPWGITQASANFGPFSKDVLIGNVGDGTISAFDPATGNFAGQIKDGDGNLIVNAGLHALAFRSDGFGDSNTLYFTAGIGNGHDGLFAGITTGLVSTTRVSAPPTPANTPSAITVTVSAGPGNSGMPKGSVTLQNDGAAISDVPLTNGAILFNAVIRGVGIHVIGAQYQGNDTFLPSFAQTELQITGPSTNLNLVAPANAAPGSSVTLTATIRSAGGTPTGEIVFLDGNAGLGTARLNAAGVATLTINTLTAGSHSLTASYAGDGNFGNSTSAPVTTIIASRDFSLAATPPSATVSAGQSAIFNVAITSAGGFADPVTFSCPSLAGITCNFSPAVVTPNEGVTTAVLTVTTSANVLRFGRSIGRTGSGLLIAGMGLVGILVLFRKKMNTPQVAFLRAAAGALAVVTLALTLASCGGYTTNGQSNRGTATIVVTAQSGAISHATSVSVTVQ